MDLDPSTEGEASKRPIEASAEGNGGEMMVMDEGGAVPMVMDNYGGKEGAGGDGEAAPLATKTPSESTSISLIDASLPSSVQGLSQSELPDPITKESSSSVTLTSTAAAAVGEGGKEGASINRSDGTANNEFLLAKVGAGISSPVGAAPPHNMAMQAQSLPCYPSTSSSSSDGSKSAQKTSPPGLSAAPSSKAPTLHSSAPSLSPAKIPSITRGEEGGMLKQTSHSLTSGGGSKAVPKASISVAASWNQPPSIPSSQAFSTSSLARLPSPATGAAGERSAGPGPKPGMSVAASWNQPPSLQSQASRARVISPAPPTTTDTTATSNTSTSTSSTTNGSIINPTKAYVSSLLSSLPSAMTTASQPTRRLKGTQNQSSLSSINYSNPPATKRKPPPPTSLSSSSIKSTSFSTSVAPPPKAMSPRLSSIATSSSSSMGAVGIDRSIAGPESPLVPSKTAGHALPPDFPPTLAWRALGLYTCLRTFSRLLALSPFSTLAFLRGLSIPYRSALLDEIHVNLLRVLAKKIKVPRRNEAAKGRCQQWGYLDRQTWPLYFYYYFKARKEFSWDTWEDAEELSGGWDEEEEKKGLALSRELAVTEWHQLAIDQRLGILEYLCNRLMDYPEVYESMTEKNVVYDQETLERTRYHDGHADTCYVCRVGGDLLLCDTCPAVYHYKCVGERAKALPPTWICPECRFPDPSHYAGRVPEHYCRVSYRSDATKEEDWTLRVVHGFVFRQVADVQGSCPQLLSPSETYHLLRQLGPKRASRWPFTLLLRPPGLFSPTTKASITRLPTTIPKDGGGEKGQEEEDIEVEQLSLDRSLLRFPEDDPTIPEYTLDTILNIAVGPHGSLFSNSKGRQQKERGRRGEGGALMKTVGGGSSRGSKKGRRKVGKGQRKNEKVTAMEVEGEEDGGSVVGRGVKLRQRKSPVSYKESSEEEEEEGSDDIEDDGGRGGEGRCFLKKKKRKKQREEVGSQVGEEEEDDEEYDAQDAEEEESEEDDDDEDSVVRSSHRRKKSMEQQGEGEEEEGEGEELEDDPDDYLAKTSPDLHQLRLRLRVQSDTDPQYHNPFFYVNKYKVAEAADIKPLALSLIQMTWKPTFSFPIRPPLEIEEANLRSKIISSIPPLPPVTGNRRLEHRPTHLHLEKIKDMMLQMEHELKGLLSGPWENGLAAINHFSERLFLSTSVGELGRMCALLVMNAHPRALISAWHNSRPGLYTKTPATLARGPAREEGPLVGLSGIIPRLVGKEKLQKKKVVPLFNLERNEELPPRKLDAIKQILLADKGTARASRGLPVRERKAKELNQSPKSLVYQPEKEQDEMEVIDISSLASSLVQEGDVRDVKEGGPLMNGLGKDGREGMEVVDISSISSSLVQEGVGDVKALDLQDGMEVVDSSSLLVQEGGGDVKEGGPVINGLGKGDKEGCDGACDETKLRAAAVTIKGLAGEGKEGRGGDGDEAKVKAAAGTINGHGGGGDKEPLSSSMMNGLGGGGDKEPLTISNPTGDDMFKIMSAVSTSTAAEEEGSEGEGKEEGGTTAEVGEGGPVDGEEGGVVITTMMLEGDAEGGGDRIERKKELVKKAIEIAPPSLSTTTIAAAIDASKEGNEPSPAAAAAAAASMNGEEKGEELDKKDILPAEERKEPDVEMIGEEVPAVALAVAVADAKEEKDGEASSCMQKSSSSREVRSCQKEIPPALELKEGVDGGGKEVGEEDEEEIVVRRTRKLVTTALGEGEEEKGGREEEEEVGAAARNGSKGGISKIKKQQQQQEEEQQEEARSSKTNGRPAGQRRKPKELEFEGDSDVCDSDLQTTLLQGRGKRKAAVKAVARLSRSVRDDEDSRSSYGSYSGSDPEDDKDKGDDDSFEEDLLSYDLLQTSHRGREGGGGPGTASLAYTGGGLDDAELEEDEEDLSTWGSRIFELGLDEIGQVELVRTRHVDTKREEVENIRIKNMRGGRRCHLWEDRAALPGWMARKMARRQHPRSTWLRPMARKMARRQHTRSTWLRPVGVTYPRLAYKLPKPTLSQVWVYRAQHARTSAELMQLLRILEQCLDHERLQELEFYHGMLKGHRPAQHPEAVGGLEYRFHRLGEEDGEGEWIHEDSIDLRLIKTYRRTVVDPANTERVRKWAYKKTKIEISARKKRIQFVAGVQDLWKGLKARIMDLVPEEVGSENVIDEFAEGVGKTLVGEARSKWLDLFRDFQNKMVDQLKKKWDLGYTPQWKREVTLRDYEGADTESQLTHSLKDLLNKCKADVRLRIEERRRIDVGSEQEGGGGEVEMADASSEAKQEKDSMMIAQEMVKDMGVIGDSSRVAATATSSKENKASKLEKTGADRLSAASPTATNTSKVDKAKLGNKQEAPRPPSPLLGPMYKAPLGHLPPGSTRFTLGEDELEAAAASRPPFPPSPSFFEIQATSPPPSPPLSPSKEEVEKGEDLSSPTATSAVSSFSTKQKKLEEEEEGMFICSVQLDEEEEVDDSSLFSEQIDAAEEKGPSSSSLSGIRREKVMVAKKAVAPPSLLASYTSRRLSISTGGGAGPVVAESKRGISKEESEGKAGERRRWTRKGQQKEEEEMIEVEVDRGKGRREKRKRDSTVVVKEVSTSPTVRKSARALGKQRSAAAKKRKEEEEWEEEEEEEEEEVDEEEGVSTTAATIMTLARTTLEKQKAKGGVVAAEEEEEEGEEAMSTTTAAATRTSGRQRARKPLVAVEDEKEDEEEEEEEDDALYCICRQKEGGKWMIACELCNEWFHGKCVNLTKKEGEKLDVWFCPTCRANKRRTQVG